MHIKHEQMKKLTGKESGGSAETQILVVEDNMYSAYALITIFDQYQIAYTLVSTGKEAVDKVQLRMAQDQMPYKLILMDLFLPQMNGLEASDKIMQFTRLNNIEQPYIALITANPGSKIKKQAKQINIKNVLKKPIFKLGVQRLLIDAKLIHED